MVEVATGFEPVYTALQAAASPLGHATVSVCHQKRPRLLSATRADDEIRTRDPNLGKVVRYQLRHIRIFAAVLGDVYNFIQLGGLTQIRPCSPGASRIRYPLETLLSGGFPASLATIARMAGTVGKRVAQGVAVALVVAVAAGGLIAYTYRGEIRDHFLASSFEPTQRVNQIRDEIELSATGDRVFLASQPTIGGRDEFNRWCAGVDHTEEGHVLGCFAERRIRLFEVTDQRLTGVVETTAAHELLHAAWSRMSQEERAELTDTLVAEYDARAATDAEFSQRMSVYESLSRSAFANELHSVFGTEVRELSPELEQHYAKWFEDRSVIVDWYDGYHGVFVELKAEAERLSAELEELRSDIEDRSATYDVAVQQFNADAAEFRERNERYEFSGNKQLFDTLRGELLARQEGLDAVRQEIQADTDRFNALREELVKLNDVSVELNDVLDSTFTPPSSPVEQA